MKIVLTCEPNELRVILRGLHRMERSAEGNEAPQALQVFERFWKLAQQQGFVQADNGHWKRDHNWLDRTKLRGFENVAEEDLREIEDLARYIADQAEKAVHERFLRGVGSTKKAAKLATELEENRVGICRGAATLAALLVTD